MVSIMTCRRLFVIYSLNFIIQLTNAENSWDNRSLPKPFVSPSSQVVHRKRIKVKERIEKSSHETSCSSADVDNNYLIDTFLSLRGGWSTPIAFSPTAASMLAGSFAGAIGVGVSFPLDTLKTKSQVLGKSAANLGMIALSRKIFASEGIRGFFSGVRGMMVGQAIIKSIAFSSNRFALGKLSKCSVPMFHSLLLSAAFAGFVTSFIVAPIERVKIMMQANTNLYKNEIECIKAIFKAEGFRGFLGRGLNPTIVREVPSYCIYFALYGVLMSTPLFMWLGSVAPLVGGALSGMSSWLPVYPVDVVKSLVQNTEGEVGTTSSIDVARKLYREGGVAAFFDGLTPKMVRAGVNHAITFWLYEICIGVIPVS